MFGKHVSDVGAYISFQKPLSTLVPNQLNIFENFG